VDAMGTMAVVMQLQEGGEVVGGDGIARDGEGAVVLGCGVQLKRSSGGVLCYGEGGGGRARELDRLGRWEGCC
jgi:hypothetical protein